MTTVFSHTRTCLLAKCCVLGPVALPHGGNLLTRTEVLLDTLADVQQVTTFFEAVTVDETHMLHAGGRPALCLSVITIDKAFQKHHNAVTSYCIDVHVM